MKGKQENIELICRVDQDELGFHEDDFDDLKALFMLFDFDQDGVVSMKEAMGMLRCVGFRADEEQIKSFVCCVGVDKTGFSLSFNEFLTLVSTKRREDPCEASLMSAFLTFDPQDTGLVG